MDITTKAIADQLAQALVEHREAHGYSLKDLERAMWNRHIAVSDETLRKLHRGEIDPTTPSHFIVVLNLARLYGVRVSALCPDLEAASNDLSDLLEATSGWIEESLLAV